MLVNALKYKDKIKDLECDAWYDEKYMYYYCGNSRYEEEIGSGKYGNRRHFASIKPKKDDKDVNIIGLISYAVDAEISRATNFAAINFTDDIYTMGGDIFRAIDDIFNKFNLNALEWWCVTGNPIERSYDKLVDIYGGRIVGVLNDTVRTMDGKMHGSKIYEILREDYLKAQWRRKGFSKLNKPIQVGTATHLNTTMRW